MTLILIILVVFAAGFFVGVLRTPRQARVTPQFQPIELNQHKHIFDFWVETPIGQSRKCFDCGFVDKHIEPDRVRLKQEGFDIA